MTEVIFWAYVVAVHLLAVVATAFPIRYRRRTWRDTEGGRVTMLTAVSVAALADVSVLGFWWIKLHLGGPAAWWAIETVIVLATAFASYRLHRMLNQPEE